MIQKLVKEWANEYADEHRIVLGDFNEIVSALDYTADHIQARRPKGKLHTILERKGMTDTIREKGSTSTEHTRVGITTNGNKSFSRLDYIYCDKKLAEKVIFAKTMYDSQIVSDHMPIWIALNMEKVIDQDTEEEIKIQRNATKKSWERWREKASTRLRDQTRLIRERLKTGNTEEINDALQLFTKIALDEAKNNLRKLDSTPPIVLAIRDDPTLHEYRRHEKRERREFNTKITTSNKEAKKWQGKITERKKEIIKEKNKAKWEETLDRIKQNPTNVFRILKKTGKKAKKTSEKPSAVQMNGNRIVADPESVKSEFARQWKETFTSKGEREEQRTPWLNTIKKGKHEKIIDIEIRKEDIMEEIGKLKMGKAAGPDKVSNEMIRNMSNVQIEILTEIMDAIRTSKKIPKSWKESTTILLFKGKGDKADLMAYRPIALLPCLYKIYSAIQNKRLTKWMEENKISTENQHGFRKGTDTADAAAELIAIIQHAKDTGKPLHVALLDIAKAYDSVEHWAMKETLEAYGLNQNDVDILMDMITGSETRFDTAYGLTGKVAAGAGVRQGDTISPVLYLLFLNPLLIWLETSGIGYQIGNKTTTNKAFADDMALISGSKKGIETLMNRVNRFMEYNRVTINATKSQYHWNNDIAATVKTRGHRLKEEGEAGYFTYLGWTTNLLMDWSVQIQECMQKYINTCKAIMSEKGLTINQRTAIVNVIASTSILYRTKIMMEKNNIWLEELDKWTIKLLNKRSNSSTDTHAAYWWKYRGWKSLKIESEALFINHICNRILNDKKLPLATKAIYYKQANNAIKYLGIRIENDREDKIDILDIPTELKKILKKWGIRWIEQLTTDGKAITATKLDKCGIRVPDKKKLEKWTKKVEIAVNKTIIKEKEKENDWYRKTTTVYTDGSLKDGQAKLGIYFGKNDQRNRGWVSDGLQEINNAELKAILVALEHTKQSEKVEIISDSLNSVRYTIKACTITNRIIRKQKNTCIKLRIKNELLKRKTNGQQTEIRHVRSHANDKGKKDASKRKEENKRNFGRKQRETEAGNDGADEMAEGAQGPRHINEPRGEERFYVQIDGMEYIDNLKAAIKDREYYKIIKEWRTKQKRRSAFDTATADKDSLPHRTDGFANFWNKVMTGTTWTNKRKCQLNMRTDDTCPICRTTAEKEVTESHQHVLGECEMTLRKRDELWTELQRKWKEAGVNTMAVQPWFNTKNHNRTWYKLDAEMCNKGLIPKLIYKILKKDNKKIDLKRIKKITKKCVRRNITIGYLERMKIVKEIEKLEEIQMTEEGTPAITVTAADPRQRKIAEFFK